MKTVRMTVDARMHPVGRIDAARVDATTEADIARHIAADTAEAARDAGRYVRQVRRRLGLTQVEFAEGVLGISVDTFSRWVDGRTDVRVGVVLASRCGARFRDELISALVSEREKAA